jgi:ribosomal protein S18 acetylase RimI-like enzyme
VRTWHHTYDGIYGPNKVTEITDRWHSLSNLSRQVSLPLSLFLVAEKNGKVVGTSKATGSPTGGVKLDRLYVDPDAQGARVGEQLLKAMLSTFPAATHIDLEVEAENVKALAFYHKHGFDHLGTTEECGGNSGVPAMTMRRKLAANLMFPLVLIRPVRDNDAQDLIGLITLCFAEYPGCIFDPHDDMPDIIQPAKSKLATDGQFLVVEDSRGRVAACIAVDFPDAQTAELHRLYVRPDMRGQGLARELTARVEAFAKERGAKSMILWTDTRFTKAHQLYASMGYKLGPTTRSLGDLSNSREFFFEKKL